MSLSPGSRLGPYEIVSAIGAGGMAEVFKARDTRLDRIVALKVLSAHLARGFSKDGSRMAFRSRVASINPVSIPFDPATNRAGVPVVVDGSNNIRVPSDVSPDGKQIAYFRIGERQEDAFISNSDATRMRRVTDDAIRDRAPMFTRDGKSLVFYSNRDGNWGAWSIQADGGNLRKIAGLASGIIYSLPSPVDDTVVFSGARSQGVFSTVLSADPSKPSAQLPATTAAGGGLFPVAWSRDGAKLVGVLLSKSGAPVAGLALYDMRARTATPVTTDQAFGARFLPDNRRLIYFTQHGQQLIVLDTVTHQRTVVPVPLPGPAVEDLSALSPDGRMIYYGAVRAEADIWIAERK